MIQRVPGSLISISGPLTADDLALDPTADAFTATYTYEVTGLGPLQDGIATTSTPFTVVAGSTEAQIAAAALAAVNAAIAAG